MCASCFIGPSLWAPSGPSGPRHLPGLPLISYATGGLLCRWPSITEWEMYITAQGCRLRNDLYCVEWDVKLYYTIPYHTRRPTKYPVCDVVVCLGDRSNRFDSNWTTPVKHKCRHKKRFRAIRYQDVGSIARVVFAGGGGGVPVTEFRGMALNFVLMCYVGHSISSLLLTLATNRPSTISR